jgi:hypothetical protein
MGVNANPGLKVTAVIVDSTESANWQRTGQQAKLKPRAGRGFGEADFEPT